ncbi:NUDIX hydrolase domain-like protein [Lipomyces tetrasporus]|uniref:NUDIX hydrolase domain-like protein n=1 Tax=Lipomyces tetrasporus TaxID=54092 RepID=A0AAD7VPB1_9ASCO|nr:NUDIX hydrolase domain-like protein [Lipomyces tetrasporus]KAJ8096908.1 NUDIX hydrolase domain-like protein [Lipomyces tetrasporus]
MPKLTNLELTALADSFPYPNSPDHKIIASSLYQFTSHDLKANLGYLLPFVVDALRDLNDLFVVSDADQRVSIRPEFDTVEKRSKMMNDLALKWRIDNKFRILEGWRSELYPIYYPSSEIYFTIERSASAIFGFVTYGVHMTAYVAASDSKPLRIWVPRRSRTKATYPSMLDNTVAGGIGYPYGVFDTLIKECGEEAGFDPDLIKEKARSVGNVSYYYIRTSSAGGESGFLQPEVQYCYDLEVTEDTPPPRPVDGEAEDFYLWDLERVKEELAVGNYKPNTALVTLDFLVRHGVITPENEPNYLEITSRMHRHLEHPLR